MGADAAQRRLPLLGAATRLPAANPNPNPIPHTNPNPNPNQALPRGYLLHYPHKMSSSGRKWQMNANDHRARMDSLFEQQLAAAQGQRSRALLESEPRDGCAAVTPECDVPLIQQVDMLQPSAVGRRALLKVEG